MFLLIFIFKTLIEGHLIKGPDTCEGQISNNRFTPHSLNSLPLTVHPPDYRNPFPYRGTPIPCLYPEFLSHRTQRILVSLFSLFLTSFDFASFFFSSFLHIEPRPPYSSH